LRLLCFGLTVAVIVELKLLYTKYALPVMSALKDYEPPEISTTASVFPWVERTG